MAPPIPDRWLDYKPVGERIEGTRFIAFKVPLREHVIRSIELDNRLDAAGLLKSVPNLGLIIDLTNTNRYYDPDSFRKNGVEHKKLMVPGHVTPPTDLVNRFKLYVMSFLNSNKDNDKLIGVHCTHGVNRTGYLICNYMISELTMSPKDAIQKFDAARGHKIERKNYLESLADLTNHDASPSKKRNLSTDKEIVGYSSNRTNATQNRRSIVSPVHDNRRYSSYAYAAGGDHSSHRPSREEPNWRSPAPGRQRVAHTASSQRQTVNGKDYYTRKRSPERLQPPQQSWRREEHRYQHNNARDTSQPSSSYRTRHEATTNNSRYHLQRAGGPGHSYSQHTRNPSNYGPNRNHSSYQRNHSGYDRNNRQSRSPHNERRSQYTDHHRTSYDRPINDRHRTTGRDNFNNRVY